MSVSRISTTGILAAAITGGVLTFTGAATAEVPGPVPATPAISAAANVAVPSQPILTRGSPAPPEAPPATVPSRSGAAPAQALQWIEAHSIVDVARVRSSPVNGRIIAGMPRGAGLWTSCRRLASDGYWWAWVAYNDRGDHWVAGWTRGDLVRMVRPNTLPSC